MYVVRAKVFFRKTSIIVVCVVVGVVRVLDFLHRSSKVVLWLLLLKFKYLLLKILKWSLNGRAKVVKVGFKQLENFLYFLIFRDVVA